MTEDIHEYIASLISEDLNDPGYGDLDEYEGLDDTDEFAPPESGNSWGAPTGWHIDDWPMYLGHRFVLVKGEVAYVTTRLKGWSGSFDSPSEPPELLIEDPRVNWFRISDMQGNVLASWNSDWMAAHGKAWQPGLQGSLTDEEIKAVKDFLIDLWERQEDEVFSYESENNSYEDDRY